MRIFKYAKCFDNGNKLTEYRFVSELQFINIHKTEYKHNGIFYSPESTETKRYHLIKDNNELNNLISELETKDYKKIEL